MEGLLRKLGIIHGGTALDVALLSASQITSLFHIIRNGRHAGDKSTMISNGKIIWAGNGQLICNGAARGEKIIGHTCFTGTKCDKGGEIRVNALILKVRDSIAIRVSKCGTS